MPRRRGVDRQRALGGEAREVMRAAGLGPGAGQAFAAERQHADDRANVSRPRLGATFRSHQVAAAKGPTCNCALEAGNHAGAFVASRGEHVSRIELPAVNPRFAVLDVAAGRFVRPAGRQGPNAMRDAVVDVRLGEVGHWGEAWSGRDRVAARSGNQCADLAPPRSRPALPCHPGLPATRPCAVPVRSVVSDRVGAAQRLLHKDRRNEHLG